MGHDIRGADDKSLVGWDDSDLFELAASEERITITANARHFIALAQEWHDAGRDHGGLILLPPSVRHDRFGKIIARVSAQLEGTTQQEWVNRTVWA